MIQELEKVITFNCLIMLYFNENNLYINFINQNRNVRGIYYMNNFTKNDSSNPRMLLLNSQIYPNNAYSYNIIENKFFVITTQDFIAYTSGPQLFSYYFNYNDLEENVIQSVKIAEKTTYSKFSAFVPPIMLNNSEILMLDFNRVYNTYQAALFSHMFSHERSILNNNVSITKDEAIFFNNLVMNISIM